VVAAVVVAVVAYPPLSVLCTELVVLAQSRCLFYAFYSTLLGMFVLKKQGENFLQSQPKGT